MSTPVFVLAGQSNAARISSEVEQLLQARYGAGGYSLVHAHSPGAPLTTIRETKDDWLSEGELRAELTSGTIAALSADPVAKLAGVFWIQGEADTFGSSRPQEYQQLMIPLVDEFRDAVGAALPGRDTGVFKAPVVISRLSDFPAEADRRGNWQAVQDAQTAVANADAKISLVDPDEVAAAFNVPVGDMFADNLHYSGGFSLLLAQALIDDLETPGTYFPEDRLRDDGEGEDAPYSNADQSGDNVYYLAGVGDQMPAGDIGGRDEVIAGISVDLRAFEAEIEDLTLTGADGLDGTGNALDNVLRGNAGSNDMRAGAGADLVLGGMGNDILRGEAGDDTLDGGTGNDVLIDWLGANVLRAGDGDDRAYGGEAQDAISGGDGADLLVGRRGADDLYGDAGADRLFGNDGADRLFGGAGQDTMSGGNQDDQIDGGTGDDVVKGGNGHDLIAGDAGDDTLRGNSGDDRLDGGAGHDVMAGNLGADILAGRDGNDRIFGGGGNDTLEGGAGRDVLGGGVGADVFVFKDFTDSRHRTERDLIVDFTSGEDQIDLSGIMDDLTFVGTDAYSGAAGEVRYNSEIGRLYIDINGGGASDMSIDLLGRPDLQAEDLIL